MKRSFQQLNSLYLALFLAQAFFCLTVVYINSGEPEAKVVLVSLTEGPNFLKRILLMLGLPLIGAAWMLGFKRAQEGAMIEGIEAKVAHYRQTAIWRFFILVAVNVLAIVFAWVDNDMSYLLYFAGGLLFFLAFRPSAEGFIRKYALSDQEASLLREHA